MNLVTVIMPVYNREKYLAEAIDSVLCQTYNNFELIIIDDGSTDRSLSIAENYQSVNNARIRIIKQANQGPSVARNNAIKVAKGELIGFIDSDDKWTVDKLEMQVKLISNLPSASFVYSGYSLMNEQGEITRECLPDKSMEGQIYKKLWTKNNNMSGGTVLVRTETITKIGLFDEDLEGGENFDLRVRLSKMGPVYFVNKSLYYYRKHSSNLTTDILRGQKAWLKLINKHLSRSVKGERFLYNYVISKYYHNIGMYKFSNMEMLDAAQCFCKSIAKYPLSIRSYAKLFRCCLGAESNKFLARLKKKFLLGRLHP